MNDSEKSFILKVQLGYVFRILKAIATLIVVSGLLILIRETSSIPLPETDLYILAVASLILQFKKMGEDLFEIIGAKQRVRSLGITFLTEEELKEKLKKEEATDVSKDKED